MGLGFSAFAGGDLPCTFISRRSLLDWRSRLTIGDEEALGLKGGLALRRRFLRDHTAEQAERMKFQSGEGESSLGCYEELDWYVRWEAARFATILYGWIDKGFLEHRLLRPFCPAPYSRSH